MGASQLHDFSKQRDFKITPLDIDEDHFLTWNDATLQHRLAQRLDAEGKVIVKVQLPVLMTDKVNRSTRPHTAHKGPARVMVLVCAVGHETIR